MRFFRSFDLAPILASLALTSVLWLAVMGLWRLGMFQFLELKAYDVALRHLHGGAGTDSPVVIIGVDDEDIRRYGWALSDSRLSEALEILSGHRPRVIGVDLYRDQPEPRTGEFLDRINATLANHPEIVWIYSVVAGIGPPPVLAGAPERVGFNDVPADGAIEKVVRRGLLFMNQRPSFGLQVASLYLFYDDIVPVPDERDPRFLRLGRTTFRDFRPDDGAYVNADAGGQQFLLDFKAPRPFRSYALRQLFDGGIPAEALRDRVVLVGVTAQSVKDYVNTPLGFDQNGVEVHGQIVDQLVRAARTGAGPMRSWAEWVEAVWITFWAFAGASLGYHVRSPLVLVPALFGCGAVMLAGFAHWFGEGVWIPVASPMCACLPAAAVITSYAAQAEKRERRLLMQLFSRHVSADIAEEVWKERRRFLAGDRPQSQKLTATVLFTDLKGFSSIAEEMDPERLFDWLNAYLDRMVQVVNSHGGVIRQFAGDAVIAVFGAPIARTTEAEIRQDAIDAVRCALAMGGELAKLNEAWERAGLPTAGLRAGIHTGPLAAGSVGGPGRLEYAVIGDTVNIAARLESYDKDVADPDKSVNRTRILVSSPTFELLGPGFESRFIGAISVKGKMNQVTVHQILAELQPGEPR